MFLVCSAQNSARCREQQGASSWPIVAWVPWGGVFGSLFALASAAGQSVQVELYDSAGALVQPAQTFASGSAVNLGTISADVARINIFSVGSGLANVGSVTFETATRGSQLVVFLGQGVPPQDSTLEVPDVAINWGGLTLNAGTQQWIRLSAGIAGDLTGPVFADTINRLQIGGAQNGAINASATLGDVTDIKAIVASQNGPDADISSAGSIGSIVFTLPHPAKAVCSAIVAGESIGSIEASGMIGPAFATPLVDIRAADGIGLIRGSSIFASIETNANGGDGGIERVVATNGGFYGELRASSAGDLAFASQPWLETTGERYELDADVFIEGNAVGPIFMSNASLSAPSLLSIAGSWKSGSNTVSQSWFSRIEVGGDLEGRLRLRYCNNIVVAGRLRGDIEVDEIVEGIVLGEFARGNIRGDDDLLPNQPGSFFLSGEPIRLCPSITVLGDVASEGVVTIQDAIDTRLIVLGDVLEDASIYRWSGILSLPAKAQLIVGGNLAGDVSIEFRDFLDGENPILPNAQDFTDQIIVGASGSGGVWTGELYFVDDQLNVVVLDSPSFSYPHFTSTNSTGAVGVVPFRVHNSSTDLINISPSSGWPTETQFNNRTDICSTAQLRGIEVDMYGPVRLQNPNLPAFQVERNFGGTWVDLSSRLEFSTREAVAGAGFDRIVVIRGKPGYGLPRGTYRVTPTDFMVNGVGNLVCDELLTTNLVAVSSAINYQCTLQADCNMNCVGDGSEPGPIACNPTGVCDHIDFNNNGAFPEDQDTIDFFNVLAGGSCSAGNTCNDIDFNNNGAFPEDQDVIDFFNVLSGGECSNTV
jgi:hypothetical protein